MAKKKLISKESVKEQDEFVSDKVEEVSDFSFLDTEEYKEEKAAEKLVKKKKGLSSFGAMLKAQNAKRKERKKMYGKEN